MLGSTKLRASEFDPSEILAARRSGERDKTQDSLNLSHTRMKRLTLDLPEDLHRSIKLAAVKEGVTMAEKLRALLMEHYGLGETRKDSSKSGK
jgi:hypothetical protein